MNISAFFIMISPVHANLEASHYYVHQSSADPICNLSNGLSRMLLVLARAVFELVE